MNKFSCYSLSTYVSFFIHHTLLLLIFVQKSSSIQHFCYDCSGPVRRNYEFKKSRALRPKHATTSPIKPTKDTINRFVWLIHWLRVRLCCFWSIKSTKQYYQITKSATIDNFTCEQFVVRYYAFVQ